MRRNCSWESVLLPVPDEAHARVECTLDTIMKEGKSMKTRTKGLGTIAIAAILTVLLAGTALAIGSALGILDFTKPRVSEDEARGYIEQNLGVAEGRRARLTLREAHYDGLVLRAIFEIAPKSEGDCVELTGWQDEETAVKMNFEDAKAPEGAANVIRVAGGTLCDSEDAYTSQNYARGTVAREGNALLVYMEREMTSDSGKVDMLYSLVDEGDYDASLRVTIDAQGTLSVPLKLNQTEFQGITILSAEVRYTPFAAYLEVKCAPTVLASEAAYTEISQVYDPEAIYYATPLGKYAHKLLGCSGMAKAQEMKGGELIAEKRPPCPVCFSQAAPEGYTEGQLLYNWTFDLLAADGESLTDRDSPWKPGYRSLGMNDENGTSGAGTDGQVMVSVLKSDIALEDIAFLKPLYLSGDYTAEPIPCQADSQ